MVNWENTFQEIARAKPSLAILPIGAIEQHSYHLPVGTDFFAAQALSRRVAALLEDCYLLPALPFSCSKEHCDFAGTVWVRPATLAAILEDIVGAVHHHGIEKVVLMVAHGGNWIIKPTVRELNLARTGVRVITTNPDSFTVGQGGMPDIHSGRSETSLILHLYPHLVKREAMAPDFAPEQGREFMDYTGVAGVSPTGLWGAPSKGTAEEGAEILEHAADRAVEYIRRTFADFDRLEAEREQRARG